MFKVIIHGIIIGLFWSCTPGLPNGRKLYCGYELLPNEYDRLKSRIELQESAYEADSLYNIYDRVNTSVRAAMPDSVEFEVFLSLLNEDEVGIDVIVPGNKSYFEKIGCAVMNSGYKGKMPEQRFLCIYTYTNPDGSGDSPLEIALRRNSDLGS
jgi:hypothetical protein